MRSSEREKGEEGKREQCEEGERRERLHECSKEREGAGGRVVHDASQWRSDRTER